MNNADYLNQISATNRSTKASAGGLNIKNPKILIAGLAAAFIIAIAMILSSVFGSVGNKERDLVDQISFRTTYLMESVKKYNNLVKDSTLRSMGTSLNAILLEVDQETTATLKNDFNADKKKPRDSKTEPNEKAHIEKLNETLEKARLNGLLDRYYSREISYEISLLVSLMSECVSRTKKPQLTENLNQSITNLSSIQTRMSDYYTTKAE